MNTPHVLPIGQFHFTDSVVRRDGTATYDFELVVAGEVVELPNDAPNTGAWIVLDACPN